MSDKSEKPLGQIGVSDQPVDPVLAELGLSAADAKNFSMGNAPAERVLDAKTAGKMLDEIIRKGRLETVKKILVLNTIIGYFIENGSSPRGPYSATLEVGGKSFPAKIIAEVMHGRQRQFFRLFAQRAYDLALANPDKTKQIADLRGFHGNLWPYCFDVAEHIPGLPESVAMQIREIRNAKLSTSAPYSAFDLTSAQKVQSQAHQGPPSHGSPSGFNRFD